MRWDQPWNSETAHRIFHEYLNKGHNFKKVNRSRLNALQAHYTGGLRTLSGRGDQSIFERHKKEDSLREGLAEPDDELRMEESKKLSP